MADKSVNLLDELRAEKVKPCPFAELYLRMDSDLQTQVKQALSNPEFSTAAILRGIEKRVGKLVGGRHRLQDCRNNCNCGVLNG